MKKDIHPLYQEAQVTCGCGNAFTTRSTKDKIAVEVCSNCHPFYTGKQKFVDTAGMVERFQKKWKGEAAAKAHAIANPPPKKSAILRAQLARQQQTIAATLGAPKPAAVPASTPAAAPAPAAAAKPASPAPAPAAPAAPAKTEPAKKA
jgi:large subunit ribosomal protein L31